MNVRIHGKGFGRSGRLFEVSLKTIGEGIQYLKTTRKSVRRRSDAVTRLVIRSTTQKMPRSEKTSSQKTTKIDTFPY
jgi:hypothetical protein